MRYGSELKRQLRLTLLDAFPGRGEIDLVVGDASSELKAQWTSLLSTSPSQENALASLIDWAEANQCLVLLVKTAGQRNNHDPQLKSLLAKFEHPASQLHDLGLAAKDLESIVLPNQSFEDVSPWIAKLAAIKNSVCHITYASSNVKASNPIKVNGTGFLIAPDIIITNWHIAKHFWNKTSATKDVVVRFGLESIDQANTFNGESYGIEPEWSLPTSNEANLDFALLRLDRTATSASTGQDLTILEFEDSSVEVNLPILILQHPNAGPMKLAFGAVSRLADKFFWYKVNTQPGSSGAPCLTQSLKVVGIHSSGGNRENCGIITTKIMPIIAESLLQKSPNGKSSPLLLLPSPEVARKECEIACCSERVTQTTVDSITTLIDKLKDYFDFRWEPGTFRSETPLIFWPVRLRKPTPIHAVQTFAAAALSQMGAKVVLCLDDLGNVEHSQNDFITAIKRWWNWVSKETDFTTISFNTLINANEVEGADPWPIVQKWLGLTNKPMDEILRISKVLASEHTDESPISILKRPKPRRILNPPIVWACLRAIANKFKCQSVITLSGHDEFLLWDAWRSEISDRSLFVGHLYIPSLGDKPLHMGKTQLNWASRADIQRALEVDVEVDRSSWRGEHRMIPWCLKGCISLPDFVRSKFTNVVSYQLTTDAEPGEVTRTLAKAIDNRLLGPN